MYTQVATNMLRRCNAPAGLTPLNTVVTTVVLLMGSLALREGTPLVFPMEKPNLVIIKEDAVLGDHIVMLYRSQAMRGLMKRRGNDRLPKGVVEWPAGEKVPEGLDSDGKTVTLAEMAWWLHQHPLVPRVKRSGHKDGVNNNTNRMVQYGVTSSLRVHRAATMRCARVSPCSARCARDHHHHHHHQ